MTNVTIQFEVTGTVNQELQLFGNTPVSDAQPGEVVELLKEGKLLVTLGHSVGEASPLYLVQEGEFVVVGQIVHQNVESDMEFTGWEYM